MDSVKMGKRQKQILDYITLFIREKHMPPSVREIANAVGLNSSSTVQNHLDKLEAMGCIRRTKSKNRSIELADNLFPEESRDASSSPSMEMLEIPLVGRVAAGMPILAEENIEDRIAMPAGMFFGGKNDRNEIFALNVKGESMRDAGIMDGDIIFVRYQPNASNGEMIVAMIEDEATVKTFYKEKDRIRLQPENSDMEPISVYPDSGDFKIVGKVIGALRLY